MLSRRSLLAGIAGIAGSAGLRPFLQFGRQVFLELLFFSVGRLLFGQLLDLPGQGVDLVFLFALHALKIILQLFQLLFKGANFVIRILG